MLAALVGVLLAGGLFLSGYVLGSSRAERQNRYRILDEAQRQMEASALIKPDEKKLMQGAVRGMLQGLDDAHASYMTPEAYRVFGEELVTGRFSGVGVWLNTAGSFTKVVSVLPKSPAAAAGIAPGDIITAVDGRPVAGLATDEIAREILGKSGTRVRLKIVRDAGAARELVLSRQKLDVPTVSWRMNGRIGVIELTSFTGGVGARIRDAVTSMQSSGARGFILDLRGNPGGSLQEAVKVGNVFIDGGVVVSYRERGKNPVVYEAVEPVGTRLPLVVLVDEGSASASEIVAGAIQDRRRGLIVGTETYKKGSVQRVIPLSDGSAIKLTVASYFTPSGRAIGERGVVPDVAVSGREQQLSRANEIVSGILGEPSPKPAA